jgi:hypothetical protein
MSLIKYKYGHIIGGREDNVVRVDFAREPDPPAPKFPGANGLRPVKKEECEPQCMVSPIGPAIPVLPLTAGNSSKTVKVLVA